MSIFSERLQSLRKERGFSVQDLAEALNVTARAYQYYEQGQREPNYEKLTLLADFFQVSTDYLLGRKDAPS